MNYLTMIRAQVLIAVLGSGGCLAGLPAQAQQFGGARLRGVEVVVEERAAAREPVRVSGAPLATERASLAIVTVPSVSQSVGRASGAGSGNTAATAQPQSQAQAGNWTDRRIHRDDALLTSARLCRHLANAANRQIADKALRDMLVAKVQAGLPSGFGTHSESYHRLGNCTAEATVNVAARRLVVTARAPATRFFVRITTPDAPLIGGLPGGADPNFGINYDMNIRAIFILPTHAGGRVVQESVHYSATNVGRPQTRSVTGNLLLAMNGFVSFLGGPDFTAAIPREVNFSHGSLISLDLDSLNRPLAQSLPQDARIDIIPHASNLLLRVTTRPPTAGPVVN